MYYKKIIARNTETILENDLYKRRLAGGARLRNLQLTDKKIVKLSVLEYEIYHASEVMRLANISQLGLAFFHYPDAKRSRLSHALGTMDVGTIFFDKLIADYKNKINFKKNQIKFYREKLRLRLLMHDVGHGPFSHLFQRAMEAVGSNFDHEIKGKEKVLDATGDIAKVLNGKWEGADGLFETPINYKNDILEKIIKTIIDSSVDADKLDYLHYDAFFAGIDLSFDRERLLSSFELFQDPNDGKVYVAIEEGGVHALWEFIHARQRLFDSLYYHDVVSIYEKHMERFLSKMAINDEEYINEDTYANWKDYHVQVYCEECAAENKDAWAIANADPFKFVKKVDFNENKENDTKYVEEIFIREFGIENIIAFESKTKTHKLDEENFYVVFKNLNPILVTEHSKLLREMKPLRFWRLYVHPKYAEDAKKLAREYLR